ncbi:hypothetical protein AST99_08220 [Formosa algae]|nr:hypothetical protein AST99_08220 [Formosa algae]
MKQQQLINNKTVMKIYKVSDNTLYVKGVFTSVFNKNNSLLCLLVTTAFLQLQCSSKKTVTQTSSPVEIAEIYDASWLEATQGNIPVVISVPHGGGIKPTTIADRTCGARVADDNTALLAYNIRDAFKAQGQEPYLIVAQIARTKIDLNRDMEEATCGNADMYTTWKQYHTYIEAALSKAIAEYGYALYIDLHGQSHPIKRLELGYALSKTDLEQTSTSDLVIDSKSSIQNLVDMTKDQSTKDLLIGEHALGTFFETNGFPAVPSLQDPFPKADEPYFTGGYNTRRYTSLKYPKVFGLQIEANYKGVRDSEDNRIAFSKAFSKSVTQYLEALEQLIH